MHLQMGSHTHPDAGALTQAAACFANACALEPGMGESWANLAFVLERQRNTAGAEHAYRQAIATGCDAFELHLNWGAFLAAARRFDEAQGAYSRALQIDNTSAALWSNLGALYLALQQEDYARTCLDQALQLDPGHVSAQVNLAYLHLRHGNFAEGWQALESRNWYAGWDARLPCPRWQGAPLKAKRVLLLEAAGHGDVLQFVRYVPLLQAMGASHIALLAHPALHRLLATVEGLDAVVATDADPEANLVADFWCPLMSLPHLLQTRADNIPARTPYVRADAASTENWRKQLKREFNHGENYAQDAVNAASTTPRRVGLAWKGNPLFENDAERSIAHLRVLLPMLEVRGIEFVSLQKDATADEVAILHSRNILDAAPHLHDFADTAALMAALDLVITVDTATAHLAGALGVPCWVLLPDTMADWRWGINAGAQATHSAWYPQHMRLWRQARHGAWPEVIDTVTQALREWSTPHHETTT